MTNPDVVMPAFSTREPTDEEKVPTLCEYIYRKRAQQDSTARQHSKTAQQDSTARQHSKEACKGKPQARRRAISLGARRALAQVQVLATRTLRRGWLRAGRLGRDSQATACAA